MQLEPSLLALLVFSVLVLVLGLVLWAIKKPAGKAVTAMGIGLVITFLFYFAFVASGVYGKPGAESGYVLNILGVMVLIVGAFVAIYYIKKARTLQAES